MRFAMAALLLLCSCGTRISLSPPAETATEQPGPAPTALPEVVLVPPVNPPTPSPAASPVASASPTPTPEPSASSSSSTDVSTRAETTVNGQLFDISGQLVEGEVRLETLQGTPITKNSQTRGGTYVFNAIPAGVPIRLTAIAPGYASWSQTTVLKSNLTGDPDANRVDFGGNTQPQNVLLAGPQLTELSPGTQYAFEADDTIALGLRFDQPVDRDSIEQALNIMTPSAVTFGDLTLPAKAIFLPAERMRWQWQKDNTYATVRLPRLPVSTQVLTLAVQFTQPFRSSTGETSLLSTTGQVPFRLKQSLQTESTFRVNPDTEPLRLQALRYQPPQVQLEFNKPLAFTLGSPAETLSPEGLTNPAHYALQIDHDGSGRFLTLQAAQGVSIQDNRLSLDFGDLSAYAQRTARLVFQQEFEPMDWAGHSLETPLSTLIQL